jgi:hypothetical protein
MPLEPALTANHVEADMGVAATARIPFDKFILGLLSAGISRLRCFKSVAQGSLRQYRFFAGSGKLGAISCSASLTMIGGLSFFWSSREHCSSWRVFVSAHLSFQPRFNEIARGESRLAAAARKIRQGREQVGNSVVADQLALRWAGNPTPEMPCRPTPAQP